MKRFIKTCISFLYRLRFIKKCRFDFLSVIILKKCSFSGKNRIGKRTYLNHSVFGVSSYCGYGCEFSNCQIGKYTSIGNNVRVVSGFHPSNMVSTHPAFYSDTKQGALRSEQKVAEHLTTNNGFECEIGNDVWIGDNVLIKGGIKIGDGAIIGMGAVVTKDIEPYSIVAGVPAKVIRMRFDKKTIDTLLQIQWWEKSTDWIQKYFRFFYDPNVFIDAIKKDGFYE